MGERCRNCIYSAVIALALAGCAKPNLHPHGWIAFDVASAPLQPGWHRMQDHASGVSMDIPGTWLNWDPADQAQTQAFFDQVRRTVPGAANANLALQTQGVQPNLFAVDNSPESLKPLVFTYLVVLYADVERDTDLDKVETKLRAEGKGTVERLDLPIGPCICRYLDVDQSAAYGRPMSVRTWTIMFLRSGNLYFVRLTTPRDRFLAVRPVVEQILRTIRVTAPNPSAARPAPATSPGMGGPGMSPRNTPYGNQPPINQPPGYGSNGSGMPEAPAEPPPSAGVPGTVPSPSGPDNPNNPSPPQPPAGSTGDPTQTGGTTAGQ